MDTPVAMIVFRRPEHTARVLEAVRHARPRTLLVVADGPRPDRPGEADTCARVRSLFDTIDWPCELVRIYADENMGLRPRVGTGISQVFEHVDRAIILEDDCLPDQSFFAFCTELLDRHGADPRVMAISGDGFPAALGGPAVEHSYWFTRYCHVWGWATWRRAWAHYDAVAHRPDDAWLDAALHRAFPGPLGLPDRVFWRRWMARCYEGPTATWDAPWCVAIMAAGGLCICPDRNLVTNIGADAEGTNISESNRFCGLPTTPMAFPMSHPAAVERHRAADRWTADHIYSGPLPERLGRTWRQVKRDLRGRLGLRR